MNIKEALEKSRFITRPEINGILTINDCGDFVRIYVEEASVSYHSSRYELGEQDILSDCWTAWDVSFRVDLVE